MQRHAGNTMIQPREGSRVEGASDPLLNWTLNFCVSLQSILVVIIVLKVLSDYVGQTFMTFQGRLFVRSVPPYNIMSV